MSSSDTSLRYLLFGEDKTASKAIKGVGEQAHSTGAAVAGGLSKIGSAVGGEVGDIIDKFAAGLESVGEKSGRMGAKLAATGTVAMGLGVALQSMASGDIAAQKQLEVAVENTGKSYRGFAEDVEKVVQKQVKFGNNAVETKTSLRILTQAYNDPKKALAEMNLVTDLAAAKHISLSDAAKIVAKAHGGAGKVFREFGIVVGKNKDGSKNFDAALAVLSKKLKGQAAASMDTFSGKIKQGTTWLTNQVAVIGEKYGPAITMAGGVVTALGTVLQILQARQAAATAAQDAGTAATIRQRIATAASTVATRVAAGAARVWAAAQWLLNAAMSANPIGILIKVVALLVAGFVIAYTRSKTFHQTVDNALRAVGRAGLWMWNNALKPAFAAVVVALKAVGTAGTWLWNNAIRPAFTSISTLAKWLWNSVFRPYLGYMGTAFKGLGTAAAWLWNNAIRPAFTSIGGIAKWLWNSVFKPYMGYIVTAFKGLGAVVSGVWSNLIQPTFRAIGNVFLSTIGGMLHAAAKIVGFFNKDWGKSLEKAARDVDSAKNSMNRSWGGLKSKTITIDAVAGFRVGSGATRTTTQNVKNKLHSMMLSRATGGPVRGPGTETSDSIPALLSNDEHVWTAREVRAAGGHGAVESLRSRVLRRYASGGPVRLVARTLGMPSFNAGVRRFGGDIASVSGLLGQVMRSTLTSATTGPAPLGGGGGGGAARWASTVLQALSMLGQSPANLAAVLRLINKESGGNPNAVNNWDSNARAGHPSGGLIQTIIGTFNAYAGSLRKLGMFNPLANIFAGLNYAIHRYGSIAAVDPLRHRGGYAKGTTSALRGWHPVGERGPELAYFGGGETVVPNHRLGDQSGGVTINLTVNGAMDPNAVARQVQTMLLRLKRTSGTTLGLA